jgi:hypothetical protein
MNLSCCSDHTSEPKLCSPSCGTRSKRANCEDAPPKLSEKKKRLSFKDTQEKMMDEENIKKELEEFTSCCVRACYKFMTLQLILYCRAMYVLLPTYDQKAMWLEAEHKRLEKNSSCYCYNIDVMGTTRTECCLEAWLFAYGVSRSTHQRYTKGGKERRLNNKKLKGEKKANALGYTPAAMFFIVWLLGFAAKVGDKLPFGDAGVMRTEIRLPYPTKSQVHQIFQAFAKTQDITENGKPLSLSRACHIWKHNKELAHIKLAKYKEGFSRCEVCCHYSDAILSPMTTAQREKLDSDFFSHIAETRKERSQYYKTKCKCIAFPEDGVSLIMDAMDQRKTAIPFWLNPPKNVSGFFQLRTKLMAVKVHGRAHYCFWSSSQIVHDSNFSVECLRRALLKLETDFGKLPPTLYLQCDNGPDMKSKQFLAFCASLVERGVFQKVKLSYLVVGHTHEDIDQYFSVISRFIKHILKTIMCPSEFVAALRSAFSTPGCVPKCVEEIQYCYDTSSLTDYLDPSFSRFNLHECTGDKCHYFLIRKDSNGNATLQYKLKRYSNALYPRKFQVGDDFETEETVGQVVNSTPHRDEFTKEKFWNYTVRSKCKDGEEMDRDYMLPANDWRILVFPEIQECPLPDAFPLAAFAGSVEQSLGDQKRGIFATSQKLEWEQKKPQIYKEWVDFWASRVDTVDQVPNRVPFMLPTSQVGPQKAAKKAMVLDIDDGVRAVDVVNFSGFKPGQRNRVLRKIAAEIPDEQLDELQQGMFVVIALKPESSPWYPHDFIIGEITKSVAHLNTTDPNVQFPVQVYLPVDKFSLDKKFMKWQGDDNKLWTPTVKRGMVKAIVELTKKGSKLTRPSLNLVTSIHF